MARRGGRQASASPSPCHGQRSTPCLGLCLGPGTLRLRLPLPLPCRLSRHRNPTLSLPVSVLVPAALHPRRRVHLWLGPLSRHAHHHHHPARQPLAASASHPTKQCRILSACTPLSQSPSPSQFQSPSPSRSSRSASRPPICRGCQWARDSPDRDTWLGWQGNRALRWGPLWHACWSHCTAPTAHPFCALSRPPLIALGPSPRASGPRRGWMMGH